MANATVHDRDAPEVVRDSPEERQRRLALVVVAIVAAVVLLGTLLYFATGAGDGDGPEFPPTAPLEGELLWRQPALSASYPGLTAGDLLVLGHDGRDLPTEQGRLRAVDRLTGADRWQTDLLHPVVQPVGAAGTSLIATNGDDVVAFELETGTERWRVEAPPNQDGALPVATTDDLVVITGAGTRALDPETGNERWFVDVEGQEPPVVREGVVYLAGPGELHALDLDNGEHRWTHRLVTEGAYATPPVVDGPSVVAADRTGQLFAFDRGDGHLVWRVFLEGRPLDPDPADALEEQAIEQPDEEALRVVGNARGAVFVGGTTGTLYAHDLETGEPLWSRYVGIDFSTPGTIRPAGGVVVVGGPPLQEVLALDVESGRARWTFEVGETATAPIVGEGHVYASAVRPADPPGRDVVGLDLGTGTERWRYELTRSTVAPLLLDDGVLYVGVGDALEGDDTTIFALR